MKTKLLSALFLAAGMFASQQASAAYSDTLANAITAAPIIQGSSAITNISFAGGLTGAETFEFDWFIDPVNGNTYTVNLTGVSNTLPTAGTLEYDITIAAPNYWESVLVDSTVANGTLSTLTKTLSAGAANVLSSVNGSQVTQPIAGQPLTFHVQDVFSYSQGRIQTITNSFLTNEGRVPEPTSLALIGIGAAAAAARRRKA